MGGHPHAELGRGRDDFHGSIFGGSLLGRCGTLVAQTWNTGTAGGTGNHGLLLGGRLTLERWLKLVNDDGPRIT